MFWGQGANLNFGWGSIQEWSCIQAYKVYSCFGSSREICRKEEKLNAFGKIQNQQSLDEPKSRTHRTELSLPTFKVTVSL